MKIAFCSSEVFPFAKTGGLADVCGVLPQELEKLGEEIIIFLPRYKCVNSDNPIEHVSGCISRAVINKGSNVWVYFIENRKYFYRDGLYGDSTSDYPDNFDRFAFFCDEVLKALKFLDFRADIIHCHDWQAALIPVYLKEKYKNDPFYKQVKTVLTIHNLAFQGVFSKKQFSFAPTALTSILKNNAFEFYGKVNLLKAGILYCDKVTTVSKQYACEILTKQFGCGLEDALYSRGDKIEGILNGVDYKVWNPRADGLIAEKYSFKDFEKGKTENKIALLDQFGFAVSRDTALFGFVGRLSHQKGIDIILEFLDGISSLGARVIIQGTGEEKYCRMLAKAAKANPEKIAVHLEFEEKTAHQIYAGCDFFLMPSVFEPCGLSQLISLRYGTIPVVFKTGGLADTVIPFEPASGKGTGFVFERYKKADFIRVIKEAIKVFHKKEVFHKLVENAFHADFSWDKSAKKYQKVYVGARHAVPVLARHAVLVIGLTGCLGTGKSTVSSMFRELGAKVIDADKIAHEQLGSSGECYGRVVKEFGEGILKHGSVDRGKLAGIVFNDPDAMERLVRIVHPVVKKKIKEKVDKYKSCVRKTVVVLDVPLLFESGLNSLADLTIVVKASREKQVKRSTRHLKITKADACRRIKAQMPLKEKMRLADIIIDNNGTISATRNQARDMWKKLL